MSNTKIENVKGLNAKDLAQQFKNFVNGKPGFNGYDYSDRSSYQSDYNHYKKYADKNRAIPYWELENVFESLTPEELAHNVFDGRLYINENKKMEYITGQYYPTEYQGAAYDTFQSAKRIYDLKYKGEWNN